MNDKFLPKLSQNLLEILDDDEYYDITIEVGNDPYVKIFRAHMVILNYRSPYLRRILSTYKKENDGTLVHIKLPNILPEIFNVILRYIYGGRLSLEEYDASDIIKILVAANELNLQELVIHLQSSLIEDNANWIEQNIDSIFKTCFGKGSFSELQKYCTDLFSKDPDKIFKSPNFCSISEKLLILLIKSDNIQMNEIQVWEHVLKWGFAQHPELPSDPTILSKDEFNVLRNTLQQCIPFIRFLNLTSKEFFDKVLPYKKVLPKELSKNLVKYFLDPNNNLSNKSKSRLNKEVKPESQVTKESQSETKVTKESQSEAQVTKEYQSESQTDKVSQSESRTDKVSQSESQTNKEPQPESQTNKESQSEPQTNKESQSEPQTNKESQSEPQTNKESQSEPRITKEIMSSKIDSKIISKQHTELISEWIANIYTSIFSWIYKSNSYEFKLLFRGSRDGFTPSSFHQICDNRSSTVIIIKVKDSNEILGGYNPTAWKSDYSSGVTKNSFIFSFNKEKIESYILSRVKDENSAIVNSPYRVPSFGNDDLVISGYNYCYSSCKESSYERPIRETEDIFSVEEFEVFQVIDS
ncbi:hypothetical protein C1645_834282 [Glomus cerebriforme]|uniref:BTB/POZ domain-containing protein n=1 Tax=Glomus cerebriforme TaxID=658196 RepID=A0A397SJX4_9GLOM|nr:hypothetical protein C1645_834282 [Glomus cerebriforme]